jgi:hypothetical protein
LEAEFELYLAVVRIDMMQEDYFYRTIAVGMGASGPACIGLAPHALPITPE